MEHFGIRAVIREDVVVEAESYEEAVEIVKEIYLDQYGIELEDHEIDPTGPENLKEVLDLLNEIGFTTASNFLNFHYNGSEKSKKNNT